MVWIDETATYVHMTPSHGRAKKGKRVIFKGRKKYRRFTLIAAMGAEGVIATRLVKTGMKRKDWLAFLSEDLLPALQGQKRPIQMDNLDIHKGADGLNLIKDAGHFFFFQPPYSPEANPIEEAFSKLKNHLRYANAKTLPDLRIALKTGLASITTNNINAYAMNALKNMRDWCS